MSGVFERKTPHNVSYELGPKTKEVLACISAHRANHGSVPSYKEIGKAVNLKSMSTVSHHVHKLEELGHLRRKAKSPRNLELTVPGKAKLPDDVLDVLQRWSQFGEHNYLVANVAAEPGFGDLLWSTMAILDQHAYSHDVAV